MQEAQFYIDCFHKKYPDQHVTEVYRYFDKGVLLISSPGESPRDFGAEFFIDKDGRRVQPYNPMDDRNYTKVVNEDPIYEDKKW